MSNNLLTVKPNHFYKCEKCHIFVFPVKEKELSTIFAHDRDATHTDTYTLAASYWLEYWCEKLNCKVSYTERNSAFLVLKNENNGYIKILSKDNVGWIIYRDWLFLKEVK